VLVMGNEDRGVQPELLPHCNRHCHIPMSNDCDSLNVGAATAILLHHFTTLSPGNSPSCLSAFAPRSSNRSTI
jgi:tRNA G18 (ribose-2'-O)-methylase SpoU